MENSEIGIGYGYGSGNGSGGGGGGREDGISFGLYDIKKSPRVVSGGVLNTSPDSRTVPIKLRTNFNALAVFAPSVKTDENGNVVIDLNLPDNLTRYRLRWFNHQNLRDNRAEAFTQFLGSGIWDYEYVVRATTPGNFVASPAKAEEMYSPEVFGQTPTAFVSVR